jgi:hypothetical protein
LAVTYNFYKKFTVGGVANYNEMKSNTTNDIFVTGFNTPRWSTNISFGNREVVKNIGFNIVWRWQDSFLWESPLVTGNISAYSTPAEQKRILLELKGMLTSDLKDGFFTFDTKYLQQLSKDYITPICNEIEKTIK